MIYFTIYIHSKWIKRLSLCYHELMEKIEKHEGKQYLIVYDYMLDRILDTIIE